MIRNCLNGFAVVLAVSGGCIESDQPGDDAGLMQEDQISRELLITGRIGAEYGDSNYVFGNLFRVDHTLEGDILVLDRLESCMKLYTPDGQFIRRISNKGSGPGELENPLDMTVTEEGHILVETPWSGGLHSFTTDGEWQGLVTPFYNNPPTGIWGADGNSYIAVRTEVIADENGNLVCTPLIGRYENGEEPVVKYWEDEFPFDPGDLPGVLRNGIRSHVFCADRQGNVFLARRTSDEYLVKCFRPGGELFLEIEREAVRVEKTPAEIEEEETFIEESLRSVGSSGVALEFTAEPLRDQISDMGVDGESRIWVRRGTESVPTFDVYNYSAELLFTATVPEAGSDALYWKIVIDEQGILAYSVNPEYFQQVYVLELI